MIARILGVGGAFFLYVVVYVALRLLPTQAYAGYFNTLAQAGFDLASATCALLAVLQVRGVWRRFFACLCGAALFLFMANLGWGLVINIWPQDPNRTLESLLYRFPYLFCLLCWVTAWALLVVGQLPGRASTALLLAAALVGISLAALLVEYYSSLILREAADNPYRVFVFLYVALEVLGLVLCVGMAIIELHPYPVLIAVGYALLVASDFVFNTNELKGTLSQNSLIEVPWTAAQGLVVLGVLGQRAALQGAAASPPRTNVYAHVAIPVLSLTLGAGVVSAAIAKLVQPDSVALACYLFMVAVTAIVISVVVRTHSHRLGESLEALKRFLATGPLPTLGPHGRSLLFGSAAMIEEFGSLLRGVRGRFLPAGSDPMFPVEAAWAGEKRRQVFIAMPYSQPWSETIDRWLRSTLVEAGWATVRADQVFETRDVLQGVWKSICESEVVVAELTGRNPNVLYEVGMAHCLGKPVVLLCQTQNDIPFDLYTRRFVIYDASHPEGAADRLRQAIAGSERADR